MSGHRPTIREGWIKDYHWVGDPRLFPHWTRHAKAIGVSGPTLRMILNSALHEINIGQALRGGDKDAFVPIDVTALTERSSLIDRHPTYKGLVVLEHVGMLQHTQEGYRVPWDLREDAVGPEQVFRNALHLMANATPITKVTESAGEPEAVFAASRPLVAEDSLLSATVFDAKECGSARPLA